MYVLNLNLIISDVIVCRNVQTLNTINRDANNINMISGRNIRIYEIIPPKIIREKNKILMILLNNGYPLQLIFSTSRKDYIRNSIQPGTIILLGTKRISLNKKKQIFFYIISYIVCIFEKIKNFIKNFNVISIAYKGINKLNRFIRVYKH